MAKQDPPLDVLMVSELPVWPLDQGFRVHGAHMAAALHELGVRVGLASVRPAPAEMPASLRKLTRPWPTPAEEDVARFLDGWYGPAARLRRRLAEHQAVDPAQFAGVVSLVERHRPTVVLGLGQHAPLMLRGLGREHFPAIRRIWYAADEPISFELSCLRRQSWSATPATLHRMALYAALQWLFARGLDGAIGVSPRDAALLRLLGRVKPTVTIRNGVDLDHFAPLPDSIGTNLAVTPAGVAPRSLVFWGRMDFEPNIDAVTWFARHVWPTLKWKCPDASWQIVGKNPHPRVRELSKLSGISVVGEVADVRPFAHAAAAVLLPMRCGAGIKNKLLEAAAMGRPIIASPRAVRGLQLPAGSQPMLICHDPAQYIEAIRRVWSDAALAARIGAAARQWVERHHDWHKAAMQLVQWVNGLPGLAGPINMRRLRHAHLAERSTDDNPQAPTIHVATDLNPFRLRSGSRTAQRRGGTSKTQPAA